MIQSHLFQDGLKEEVEKFDPETVTLLTSVVQGEQEFEDETLRLDREAAQKAEGTENLFGGMVDENAEEEERLEEEKAAGNLMAEDALNEEAEIYIEDADPEEVMIYED